MEVKLLDYILILCLISFVFNVLGKHLAMLKDYSWLGTWKSLPKVLENPLVLGYSCMQSMYLSPLRKFTAPAFNFLNHFKNV